MFRSRTRRDALIVVVALVSVAFYVLMAHLMGGPGFPLDDSWIHQTYARNLGQTGIWAYVPGVPSGGSTSPFYTILLAIGYALHLPFLFWTYTLGAVFLAMGGGQARASRSGCIRPCSTSGCGRGWQWSRHGIWSGRRHPAWRRCCSRR